MSANTIVACASGAGRAGLSILRLSGADVPRIARELLGQLPSPRHAQRARWRDADGQLIDDGIALYFPAPNSFTGEHVLELHGHGNSVLTELAIERAVQLGARRARAGEFTERAFHNNRVDLAQAEALADLIDAGSRAAARAALRSLTGEFSQAVNQLREGLITLRAHVEAGIDFPDEHLDLAALIRLRQQLSGLQQQLAQLMQQAAQGRALTQGITIVIAGRPNAGKSSLLNRLTGDDTAIVTPVAGTTRDLLRERVLIDEIPFELIDTAGLRGHTDDVIEAEGMRRARDALVRADRVLFVVDAVADPLAQSLQEEQGSLPEGLPILVLMNKSDQVPASQRLQLSASPQAEAGRSAGATLWISALTGEGLEALRHELVRNVAANTGADTDSAQLPGSHSVETSYSSRSRHLAALARCASHLQVAQQQLAIPAAELAAEELRAAQQALGEVVGDISSDQLLGEIFSRFCIGK